jgi:hypothetical protein
MAAFPIHIYFEIAALLCAAIFWSTLKNTNLKWFLPFLALIVLVEIFGWYLPVYLKKPTGWIFNISVPVEYLFFSLIFYTHFRKKINKLATVLFAASFFVYTLYYSVFENIRVFNPYYLLTGSLAMIFMCIAYFFEQYTSHKTENIWNEPMFWIVTGVFLFNIGEFSYDLVSGFIIKNKFDPANKLFRSINNKLVILFYLLISLGILICRKNTKQLMPPFQSM